MITQEQLQARLILRAANIIEQAGARRIPKDLGHGFGRYEMDTPCGLIYFTPSPDSIRNGQPVTLTVFAKFAEPRRARASRFDCNIFTGKWNHANVWNPSDIMSIVAAARSGNPDLI